MTTIRAVEMIASIIIAAGSGVYLFTLHCRVTRNLLMRMNLAVMCLSAALVGIDIAMSYSRLAHMMHATREVAQVTMLVTIAIQLSVLVMHAWRLRAEMRRQRLAKIAKQAFRLPQFSMHHHPDPRK